ncbi:hypothetical protein N657DRAFT_659464 [Parathielavia appendiculata]|uniref:Uncharacterized protein n=1 Tax=Parathielavia appendiculata TaxID=2587402 RepID=A0AAN6TQE9_9PEZI|nr:hypothetical protein N657DRAFT_659464 [Parathielavia appendiculata]
MPLQESFSLESANYFKHKLTRDKDSQAVFWMSSFGESVARYRNAGVTYGLGSWGYTVLRTASSDEADALWPMAMEKLKRWATRYFVHYTRFIDGKPDPSANEDIASRFALDVLDDVYTVAEIQALNLPRDLSQASQEDIRLCDFLVIEGTLRSLARLLDETPPLDIARTALYGHAYVWLVDSQARLTRLNYECWFSCSPQERAGVGNWWFRPS